MATARSIDSFRVAAKDYLNDEQFSDFTIAVGTTEFKVHRCFIAAHSPYFKKCCDGMFQETKNARVDLVGDWPEVVQKMIMFFYTFDYDDCIPCDSLPEPLLTIRSGRPVNRGQMNAWVYAIADKYQVANLKALTLEKFKATAICTHKDLMLGAAWTIYKDIQLPDSDDVLKETLTSMWLLGGAELTTEIGDASLMEAFAEIPEFMLRVFTCLTAGVKETSAPVRQFCVKCRKFVAYDRLKVTQMAFKCTSCGGMEAQPLVSVQNLMVIKKYW